jgi:hypothetical protein
LIVIFHGGMIYVKVGSRFLIRKIYLLVNPYKFILSKYRVEIFFG